MSLSKFHGCKAVLFDFGGTLDSDGEHWLDRFRELYKNAGLDIPVPEIKRAFYHADSLCNGDSQVISSGLRPLMKHHVHLQFMALNLTDDEKERELVEAFCSKSETFLRRNALLLSRLKHRYRLGLVSNFYGNVGVLCEEAGLSKSLEIILDSVEIGVGKPYPEIFQIALRKLGLPPEQVIFVGDSYERDIIPTQELGMKAIWLKGPNPRIPANTGPLDAWISSLSELEALLP
jgi:HAD superfamily hydrolase (TIGR01549 family)